MTTDSTLPATMRAVVCRGIGDYVQDLLPVPAPAANEVLIKVARCGLCAGDAKCYKGADMCAPRVPLRDCRAPDAPDAPC